jgi:hypothetical protein
LGFEPFLLDASSTTPLKSGAKLALTHGDTMGAPRFSPYQIWRLAIYGLSGFSVNSFI